MEDWCNTRQGIKTFQTIAIWIGEHRPQLPLISKRKELVTNDIVLSLSLGASRVRWLGLPIAEEFRCLKMSFGKCILDLAACV